MTARACIFLILLTVVLCSCGSKDEDAGTATFTLPEITRSLWHNLTDPFDSNRDEKVSANDELVIINSIGRDGTRPLRDESYREGMFHYDVNFDGNISLMDVFLIRRQRKIKRDTESAGREYKKPVFSSIRAKRREQLAHRTAITFGMLCRVEPVAEIDGNQPRPGERWFQSYYTDDGGKRLYFTAYPDGTFMRLAPNSTSAPDLFIAKFPPSLFTDNENPFLEPFMGSLPDQAFGCPKP